jgi:hypothetical protein
MTLTRHAEQRMNQRGIPRRLVDFALRYGRIEGDKHVMDRRETRRLVDDLREQLRIALHVLDKGGITVVEGDGTVITMYNVEPTRPNSPHCPETLHV